MGDAEPGRICIVVIVVTGSARRNSRSNVSPNADAYPLARNSAYLWIFCWIAASAFRCIACKLHGTAPQPWSKQLHGEILQSTSGSLLSCDPSRSAGRHLCPAVLHLPGGRMDTGRPCVLLLWQRGECGAVRERFRLDVGVSSWHEGEIGICRTSILWAVSTVWLQAELAIPQLRTGSRRLRYFNFPSQRRVES